MPMYMFKNICAVAGLIAVSFLLFAFINGEGIHHRLIGKYVCQDTSVIYSFDGKKYSHNSVSGEFVVRGNKIIFETGEEYLIGIHKDYIVIDNQLYLKQYSKKPK